MDRLIPLNDSYDEICSGFRWPTLSNYNLADTLCDRHAAASPESVALIHQDGSRSREYTFRDIQRLANRFANVLVGLGLQFGDRVLLYLPQNPATAIGHVGCWKAGMISVPTSVMFGIDGLEHRVSNSGARVLVTNADNLEKALAVQALIPTLEHVFVVDAPGQGNVLNFYDILEKGRDEYSTLKLHSETPAFINYTSGTTGLPKGVCHAHRVILGHMPGVEILYDFFPQEGDLVWSPADWAWLGGLANALLGPWFHGKPVLCHALKGFDPEHALSMMGRHRVRNAFLTPTMFKLFRPYGKQVKTSGVVLRSIASGSEAVGRDLLVEMTEMFGAVINEGFGQTELNVVLGNCSRLNHFRIGALGSPIPGHAAAIIDDNGNELPVGETGNLAFKRPDPVMMLGYWRAPEATAAKFLGDWLVSGDLASCDEDGFYWFRGRSDDVITSSGYRIGPTEIEDALLRHPAVAMAAVIGVEDPMRTEIIRAYVVVRPGEEAGDQLAEELRLSVRDRLAKHEYPREIRFVEALPMTVTGKILRRTLRDQAREEQATLGPG